MYVTYHALQRWRERCATYGDETYRHILAAIAPAIRINPPNGVALNPGEWLLHNAKRGIYFVMKPDNADGIVLTILTQAEIDGRAALHSAKLYRPLTGLSNEEVKAKQPATNKPATIRLDIEAIRSLRPRFGHDDTARQKWLESELSRLTAMRNDLLATTGHGNTQLKNYIGELKNELDNMGVTNETK